MGRPKKTPACTPSGGALKVNRVVHIDPVIVDRDTTCTIVGLSPSVTDRHNRATDDRHIGASLNRL
jgi:hypothetical protein